LENKKIIGLPVFYVDRLNYTDVAYMLQDLFIKYFKGTQLTASDEDIDVNDLANFLEGELHSHGLDDLLSHDFGKGMVLGMYLEHKMELARKDEIAALQEMSDEEA
jgi:hypothetical protein